MVFIAMIKVCLRVTIRRVIASDTTGAINSFLFFLPIRTLLVSPLFYELYFSPGALLRCPSACRAAAHRAHQESLTELLFQCIISNPSCKIFSILPPSSIGLYELRKQRKFAQDSKISEIFHYQELERSSLLTKEHFCLVDRCLIIIVKRRNSVFTAVFLHKAQSI